MRLVPDLFALRISGTGFPDEAFAKAAHAVRTVQAAEWASGAPGRRGALHRARTRARLSVRVPRRARKGK